MEGRGRTQSKRKPVGQGKGKGKDNSQGQGKGEDYDNAKTPDMNQNSTPDLTSRTTPTESDKPSSSEVTYAQRSHGPAAGSVAQTDEGSSQHADVAAVDYQVTRDDIVALARARQDTFTAWAAMSTERTPTQTPAGQVDALSTDAGHTDLSNFIQFNSFNLPEDASLQEINASGADVAFGLANRPATSGIRTVARGRSPHRSTGYDGHGDSPRNSIQESQDGMHGSDPRSSQNAISGNISVSHEDSATPHMHIPSPRARASDVQVSGEGVHASIDPGKNEGSQWRRIYGNPKDDGEEAEEVHPERREANPPRQLTFGRRIRKYILCNNCTCNCCRE